MWQDVPREALDAAVDSMCVKLIDKLPECMRYTKQQLNYWRDRSWHQAIGHARDWLSLHNTAAEVREGTSAFVEKRPVDYAQMRKPPGRGDGGAAAGK